MSQHQLHTGQTTISGIPHNDSVHNLLADQGATVYGNFRRNLQAQHLRQGQGTLQLGDVHAALVVAAIVAIIDTIKATGGHIIKLCLRGNERVKRGDALSTLHNDGAYQGNPWHFLFNIGCTAIDLLCADGAGGFVKHMLMPGAFLISSKWSERSRKAWETMEECGSGLPAYMAGFTPEQWSERSRKAWETMEECGNGLPAYMAGFTPEQWSERTASIYQTLAEEGRGLPAYMAAATPDQLSERSRKAWETQEKRGSGLPAATHDQLSAYARKAHLKRRQGMCQCGECKRCRGRASATRCRAAAKAVVGTLVEVVDLAED
ncbi:hypothetical protein HYH03_002268 [Edaphochlamys debaryana]|uniref:Uncharacterized protein n=1 Tax=Edaphochlamys debaryana TaxID=47281 RepID=A0A835YFJ6_9CHLO|nr:hypothetical protein HYH03_002268 [Edaphochlamys debaryana]|eukprot:KAG2499986.1 hypothetical protein HYH03_002268 [Edaphochlamys debaryana]